MLTAVVEEVKSQDAVYVLTYSIIMLNTDLHNPQIRVSSVYVLRGGTDEIDIAEQKRMSLEDYMRNLKGVNDGSDFSTEYLVRQPLPPATPHLIVAVGEYLRVNTEA